MSRFLYLLVLIAAVGGGWYFYRHYEITGLESVDFKPRGANGGRSPSAGAANAKSAKQAKPHRTTIRIATFNFNPLDHVKLSKRHVAARMVETICRFDVLAVQNIQAPNAGLLIGLVEQINSGGRRYDFAVAADVGREPVEQFAAFLFDTAMIQVDRSTVYHVQDPGGLLLRPPLVGSFRVQGPEPAEAFTFTLINVHNEAARAISELDVLDDVFRSVRDDGRGEDDVIVLGDLGADEQNPGQLGQIHYITCAVSGVPSCLRSSRLVDNLLFDRRATSEFTGRSGVMDLMGEFNLPIQGVLEISDHFPVWAEFSVYEGGQAGHVAVDPR